MADFVKLNLIRFIETLLKLTSYLVPIKQNRILLCSYEGKSFSCNPFYIAEQLLKDKELEIVVAVDDLGKLREKNIRYVCINSFLYYYYFFSSKVLITNDSFKSFMPVKSVQVAINTWHGGGAYKRVTAKDEYTRKYYKLIYSKFSYFISSNAKFTEVMSKDLYIGKEKFINIGMPRNDIFFDKKRMSLTNKIVRSKLNLQDDDLIVLYAPTWRDDGREVIQNLMCDDVITALQNKFKKNVKFMSRAHYHTIRKAISDISIDVSDYPDMQELLCVADVLITDFSSCMWDYSLMFKPCFLYATDVEIYKVERNFYTPLSELPFSLAQNNNDLISNIENFDLDIYIKKVESHHKILKSYEEGNACEIICKLIKSICEKRCNE